MERGWAVVEKCREVDGDSCGWGEGKEGRLSVNFFLESAEVVITTKRSFSVGISGNSLRERLARISLTVRFSDPEEFFGVLVGVVAELFSSFCGFNILRHSFFRGFS